MLNEAITRGWENLVGRWSGPMSFRFLIQPAVAIAFAIRAGLRDARLEKPPFLWTLFWNSDTRHARLQDLWKDVGTVFIVALVLDSIYQLIVHAGVFTLELLITATVLAVVPYIVFRGLVTRISKWAATSERFCRFTAKGEKSEK